MRIDVFGSLYREIHKFGVKTNSQGSTPLIHPTEQIPSSLKGKKGKIARYCLHDWHYELEIEKTLEPDQTKAVLEGKPSGTMYW